MTFYVRTVVEAFGDAIRWHLAPFVQEKPGPMFPVVVDVYEAEGVDDLGFAPGDPLAPRYVYSRSRAAARISSLAGVLEHALWDIHARALQSSDFLFLHAGAVTRNGRALVVPGAMDVGKSTLTAALVEAGFGYLSDEAAAVDPVTTRVYPFPKRISLDAQALRFFGGLEDRLHDREGLSSQLPQRYVAPEDLDGEVGGPAQAGWVVFLSGERDGPPRLEPITRAEAVQQLVRYTFNLDDYGERGMVLLSRLLADARAYRLQGGDPRDRANLLAESMS